jgi:hypothetical protein
MTPAPVEERRGGPAEERRRLIPIKERSGLGVLPEGCEDFRRVRKCLVVELGVF